MVHYKNKILDKICYTELVYDRINKKLQTKYSKSEIEKLMLEIIGQTNESNFHKKGKNIYITDFHWNIILTINSFTYRLITVNKLDKSINLILKQ
jgi:hypothetical protein